MNILIPERLLLLWGNLLGGFTMFGIYKRLRLIIVVFVFVFLFVACKNQEYVSTSKDVDSRNEEEIAVDSQESIEDSFDNEAADKNEELESYKELSAEEIEEIRPNENGRIMVVMFHNFVEEFKPTTYYQGDYTTTFLEFEKLLENLYEKDYRLISMEDFLNHNIRVEAGKIPMIFTFDDATAGQFHLIKKDDELIVNPKTAVGIMEKFHEKYPDFGAKGVFYVNLANPTFLGAGTLKERLEHLVDKGYEIGNHTKSHINLTTVKDPEIVRSEVGGNQKLMEEIIPGYTLKTFSLPFGAPAGDLISHVIRGEYEGISYENLAIMEVGWQPTHSPINKNLNRMSVNRVRASGINPVQADLGWWLNNLSRGEQYISDGNPYTITVPESKMSSVDLEKIGEKKLITY
jgi:peptidoglycan/xylan/chitin deacetylase (PgdA/CDA1 family)